ncbi:MAG: DUF4296 domain-containing protein [Bacteroidales bacterium]|nr:DUF4296 domain-containing protein [Bacteroidales bacterium]
MKKYILLACCILFLFSCSGKKKKLDDNGLLTQEELVSVLIDIHLYDATVSTIRARESKSQPQLSQAYYDSLILHSHECNDSIFRASVEYYTIEGKIKSIYEQVVDSLNALRLVTEQAERAEKNAK